MAYQCLNSSYQYFTIAAPNISVPPVTFSLWINVTSVIVNKGAALFIWRGAINTGFMLRYIGTNWELSYYVAGGTQWQTVSGLGVSTGVWQHACASISSSQARLYLDGVSFTNNVSHGTANINAAGDLARDPLIDAFHTSFNGLVAEPAIWTAALDDAECRALSTRISPLCLTNRLHDLVLYKDMTRPLNRGLGPTLTAVNGPGVVAHPPIIYPWNRPQRLIRPPRFVPPYRAFPAVSEPGRVEGGWMEAAGAVQGATVPVGEVSS